MAAAPTAVWATKAAAGAAALAGFARVSATPAAEWGEAGAHPAGRAWALFFLLLGTASAAVGALQEAACPAGPLGPAACARLDRAVASLTALAGLAALVLGAFVFVAGKRGECGPRARGTVAGVAHAGVFAMLAVGVAALEGGLSIDAGALVAVPGAVALTAAGWRKRRPALVAAALLPAAGMLLPPAFPGSDVTRTVAFHASLVLSYVALAWCLPASIAFRPDDGKDDSGAAEPLLEGAEPAAGAAGPAHAAEPWEPWPLERALLAVHSFMWWSMTRLPPQGPFRLQLRHTINLHKALCTPVVLALMGIYGTWGPAGAQYLGMHGGYGLAWLAKELTFPDKTWRAEASLGGSVYLFFSMALFWFAPWCVVSAEAAGRPTSPACSAVALYLYGMGMFLLHASDSQKAFILKHREAKSGLIADGLFSRTRNPNYLGEVLLYSSFAVMASSSPYWWLPWLPLAGVVWPFLFVPSWLAKDRSLSRHAGFRAYQRRTGVLLPWVGGQGWWPELLDEEQG